MTALARWVMAAALSTAGLLTVLVSQGLADTVSGSEVSANTEMTAMPLVPEQGSGAVVRAAPHEYLAGSFHEPPCCG